MCKRVASLNQADMLTEIFSDETLQSQIVDLNQSQMYDQGIQADGSPTGDYAPITISKYKPLAAMETGDPRSGRSDHITGFNTGETYASMKAQPVSGGLIITADDRNNFFDREPEGLGLTEESLDEIIPEINERLIEMVDAEIYL